MCNLYSQSESQDAMRHVFDDIVEDEETVIDLTGNLPPLQIVAEGAREDAA